MWWIIIHVVGNYTGSILVRQEHVAVVSVNYTLSWFIRFSGWSIQLKVGMQVVLYLLECKMYTYLYSKSLVVGQTYISAINIPEGCPFGPDRPEVAPPRCWWRAQKGWKVGSHPPVTRHELASWKNRQWNNRVTNKIRKTHKKHMYSFFQKWHFSRNEHWSSPTIKGPLSSNPNARPFSKVTPVNSHVIFSMFLGRTPALGEKY